MSEYDGYEERFSQEYSKRVVRYLKRGMKADQAAKAVYKALCEDCREMGMKPEIEIFIKEPSAKHHGDNSWVVSWESGPYEWAYHASFAISDVTGKLVEPYYSFDLCFYPSED